MLLGAYKGEIPLNLITGLSPILYNCLHESVWIIHTHPTSENKEMATCRLPILTPDNLICHSEKCHSCLAIVHWRASSTTMHQKAFLLYSLEFSFILLYTYISIYFLIFPYIFSLYSKCALALFVQTTTHQKGIPISHIYPIWCQHYRPQQQNKTKKNASSISIWHPLILFISRHPACPDIIISTLLRLNI